MQAVLHSPAPLFIKADRCSAHWVITLLAHLHQQHSDVLMLSNVMNAPCSPA
jgi:hypothetical protein